MITRDSTNPCIWLRPDGRIGIFVGGGYKWLDVEVAERFAADLAEAIRAAKEGPKQ